MEKVDAASVDECAFRCVDCLIPFLRDAINNAIDDEDGIEQADEFAKRLAQIEREWPESDMVKYKALLSVVDHPSLQDATRLMGEIDQYELRPEVAQTWGYAEMMFREKYSALPEELFQTPQAAQIGQKIPAGAKLCVYVDDEEKTVTIAEAGYDHDLRDVPPYLLEMLGEAGICLGELEEQLMVGNLIYGERTACNGQEEHGDE